MAPDIAPNSTAIRAARTDAGLTQKRAAELADIDPRTLRRIENGEAKTTDEQVLVDLADAFGVPWRTLAETVDQVDRLAQEIDRLSVVADRLERAADPPAG